MGEVRSERARRDNPRFGRFGRVHRHDHGQRGVEAQPVQQVRLRGVAKDDIMPLPPRVILPALTRILPRLTPLAALGVVTIQVLAIGFHAVRGELAMALPFNLALLGLSLFVVWGRWFKAPIAPRG